VCVKVPQYYYSVGDDDFQILLERLAVGGRSGARSTPPHPTSPLQPLSVARRSGQPSCCRQRRQQLPLAVVVDGSSLDCVRQTSLSPEYGASQTAAAAAAAYRGMVGGASLTRCRSEPDLLMDDVDRGGQRRAVTPGAAGDDAAMIDRRGARRVTTSADTDTEYCSWMPAAEMLHDETDDHRQQRNSPSSLSSHL